MDTFTVEIQRVDEDWDQIAITDVADGDVVAIAGSFPGDRDSYIAALHSVGYAPAGDGLATWAIGHKATTIRELLTVLGGTTDPERRAALVLAVDPNAEVGTCSGRLTSPEREYCRYTSSNDIDTDEGRWRLLLDGEVVVVQDEDFYLVPGSGPHTWTAWGDDDDTHPYGKD